jgi:hypothetical protein
MDMGGVVCDERLRLDLAAARRARAMINDPLSLRMLSAYITELEEELHRGADGFLLTPVAYSMAG